MKYITPFDNFVNESEVYRIATDEVIPGINKAAGTEEPVKPKTEAQDKTESEERRERQNKK